MCLVAMAKKIEVGWYEIASLPSVVRSDREEKERRDLS